MTCYDIFNGDADGICALQQLRLQEPLQAELVSGLKRDIDLLGQIRVQHGDRITVLDISLDKNREALVQALQCGAEVFYADHHYAGEIPVDPGLDCHIDVAANTCTSLIINDYLQQAQARWAVVGAFGDNFDAPASELGRSLGLQQAQLDTLQQLGICLNYNGYGFELEDLLFHPVELYRLVSAYANPLDFVADEPAYAKLLSQYRDDNASARQLRTDSESDSAAVFLLPNEAWAKRIVGVFGNELAKQYPDRAHALLVDMGDDCHRVSVRAPYNRKQGADDLCRQFEGGGGRKAAAGINQLAQDQLSRFIDQFNLQYGPQK